MISVRPVMQMPVAIVMRRSSAWSAPTAVLPGRSTPFADPELSRPCGFGAGYRSITFGRLIGWVAFASPVKSDLRVNVIIV